VSWVTVVWSMAAGACFTLAVMHLLVWFKKRSAWANLFFSLSSWSVAAYAVCELWLMRSQTPGEFGIALQWLHVPTWGIVVSLIAFTRVYLRAGRLWLAWAACGARTLALLLNFGPAANLNYREVSALRHVPFLGEAVSVGEGARNPWMLVGQLSLLLFVVFVADASLAAWRNGDRRLALVVGGSAVFFAAGAALESILILWGIIEAPLTATLLFQGLVAAMGYQLSIDVLRAARLTDDLREQRKQAEEQFRLVVEASPNGVVLVNGEGRVVLVNRETERLFGYARDELLGMSVERLVPERFREDHPGSRAAFLATPRARTMGLGRELFARRKDGTEFACEIGLSPIERGDESLVLAAVVDVTARKHDEAEMLRLRDEVAHAGRLSTMAQLASGLAHELSQPLGAILRNAEAAELLLQRSAPDLEEVRAILADICKDDQRAGEVIDHMRAQLKRRGLERVELDFVDLVNGGSSRLQLGTNLRS
jgi:two-component system sensor kinase FixL